MTRAQRAWASALSVQPDYKPALDRMMQFLSDYANLNSSDPNVFKGPGGLGETATKLFAADSTNSLAEIAIQTSIIRPWLSGVEDDERHITDTLEKLTKLMDKYPENEDLPMFAAQGNRHLAEKRHQQNNDVEATRLLGDADKIMAKALKATPTAAMYFSAAQVLSMQRQVL